MVVFSLILAVAIVTADQIIKYFVVNLLPSAGRVTAIPHILDLTYVENRGVAFGMFKDMRWIFIIFTSIVICVLLYFVIFKKIKSRLFYIACSMIIGGGIGNLIDRITYGYVIDYLQLSFFNPVCNLADYFITVGTVLLVVYLLFFTDTFKKEKSNE